MTFEDWWATEDFNDEKAAAKAAWDAATTAANTRSGDASNAEGQAANEATKRNRVRVADDELEALLRGKDGWRDSAEEFAVRAIIVKAQG